MTLSGPLPLGGRTSPKRRGSSMTTDQLPDIADQANEEHRVVQYGTLVDQPLVRAGDAARRISTPRFGLRSTALRLALR